MVKVEDAVIARYKSGKGTFEVLVDCENALLVKGGKDDIDMNDVLAADTIFSDSKKGDIASEHALSEVFETGDTIEIAKQVIRKGEIQLTAEHRAKMREKKRKQIMTIIQQNGVDPRTHLPHPLTRIENAFEQAKIRIDEFKDIKLQVQEITRALQPILPIRFEIKEIQLIIPADFASKSYHAVHSFGKVLKEEWQNDGSMSVNIEIPGGLEQELYERVNAVCHGKMESKLIATR